MYSKIHFNYRRTVVTIVLLAALSGLVGMVKFAFATALESGRGWAWGGGVTVNPAGYDGMGWISFNDLNAGSGGGSYGVNIPISDGPLSGYAWSEHYGWISFNSGDLAGCSPVLSPATRVGDNLTGGARILAIRDAGVNSGGFDGCISLSGAGYGVSVAVGNTLNGHMWSSDLGWIDVTGVSIVVSAIPAATISATDCTIQPGMSSCDSTVTWSSTALSDPSIRQDSVQFSTIAANSLSRTVVGEGDHIFTVFDTSIEYASSTMTASCESGTAWDGDSCEPLVVSALSCSDDSTTISDTATAWTGSWYGTPQAVIKVDNYLYAGASGLDSTQGLYIYDVSDPTNITQRSFFSTYNPASVRNNSWGNEVLGLDVVGNYAYLATYYGGLVIVDVSNPSTPSFVGKVPLYALNPPGSKEAWDVEVVGNYAYLAAGKGLIVVDVGNKASPVVVANLDLGASISQDIIVSGNYAYVAMRDKGFAIVDITDPTNPVEQSRVTAGYSGAVLAYGIEKKDDTLYIADHYAERVSYYNVANPAAPVLLGSVPAQNPTGFDTPRELYIAGDVMYVSAGRGGLYVYDVTNSAAPVELFNVLKPPLPATAKVWGVVPIDPTDFTELAIVSDDTVSNVGVYTTKTDCVPRPDLAPAFNISGMFTQNVSIPLSATVSNNGSVAAGPFSDNFSYSWDGTNWTDINPFIAHASLGVGASEPDTSSFVPNVTGTLYLQYCVDSYDQIDEGVVNETSNCSQHSVLVNPPAQCPAGETLNWTVGADSCSGDTASPKNSGESLIVLDSVENPATGQAAFDCRNDGTWNPTPTAATCSVPLPPTVPIEVEISVDRELIRVGETAEITIDVNIGVPATCTVYGVNLTPFTFAHSGTPAAQPHPYTTRALFATQVVTVSCVADPVVAGVTAGRDEKRVDVVPKIEER